MTLEYMQDNYDEVNAELQRLAAIQMEENADAKSARKVFIGSGEDADILFPFGHPCGSEDCCPT
jgi:hypothetical protein